MAVTDLTGTKWQSKSTYSATATSTPTVYNINTINNTGFATDSGSIFLYGAFLKDSGYISSANTVCIADRVYVTSPDAWSIEIVDGADVTNQDLIAWLQENATQIVEPQSLVGATITLNSSINLYPKFSYSLNIEYGDYSFIGLSIIYTQQISESKLVFDDSNGGYYDVAFSYDVPPVATTNGQSFKLLGGDDIDDPDLLAWLQENATIEYAPQPEPTEPNIFSIGNLPIDNIYFGDLPVMKVYLGDILIYEAKPIVEDSNFLLNGGDYLYCANGDIFDTRVISVETSAGEVVTTWSGEDVQVYDE